MEVKSTALVGGVFAALHLLGSHRREGQRPTGDLNHVVIGSTEYGVVTAMDPTSGAIRWSKKVGAGHPLQIEYIQSGIVIATSTVAQLSLSDYTTIIYALNEPDGRLLWSQSIHNIPPVLFVDRGILFFSYPNEALAERAVDGKPLWTIHNVAVSASPSQPRNVC